MTRARPYLPAGLAAAMIAATALWLPRAGDVVLHTELPVALELPDVVGRYAAEDLRFCQSEACMRTWRLSDLDAGAETCPTCGARVDSVALAERRSLPADTVIARRAYLTPLGEALSVSIVVSALEQRSLHRPQQCLPAQGLVIESSEVLDVPLANQGPMRVMVLHVRRAGRGAGGVEGARAAYAYWFVGDGRETHSYLQRLFWSGFTRVWRQDVHRWAYVAVTLPGDARQERQRERLLSFIRALHPHLTPVAP